MLIAFGGRKAPLGEGGDGLYGADVAVEEGVRGGGERRARGGHGQSSFEKGHLFVADDLGGDLGNASDATVVVV